MLHQLAWLLRAEPYHFCILSQWHMKGGWGLWFGHARGWGCQAACLGRKKKSRLAASHVGGSKRPNSFTSHLVLFVYFAHCNQPGDGSRGTEGSQCCHRAAAIAAGSCHFQSTRVCVPTALHLMCCAALCSINVWRLVIPAWHCLLAHRVGGKPTLIFGLSPSLLSFSSSLH